MPIFRGILSNTCQSVGQSCNSRECSIPKNCWTRKECMQEGKMGMCYIGFRQTIFFFYFFFPPPPFFSRQVGGWTFIMQYLHPPSPSSRTFSGNRGRESISSLSSGSSVLEQCVFCLRGTTYTRNLDKLLVSV